MKVIRQDGMGDNLDPTVDGHLPELLSQHLLCHVVEQSLTVHRPRHAMINRLPFLR
jgi:hypothetical protein